MGGLVWNHPLDFCFVRRAEDYLLGQFALALRVLGGQDVAQMRVAALDLPSGSLLEALGGSAMCLKFRHNPPDDIPPRTAGTTSADTLADTTPRLHAGRTGPFASKLFGKHRQAELLYYGRCWAA